MGASGPGGHPSLVRDGPSGHREVLGIVSERLSHRAERRGIRVHRSAARQLDPLRHARRLHGGRRVSALATLPEHVEFGGDAVRPYVLLMNNHDGRRSSRCSTRPASADTQPKTAAWNTSVGRWLRAASPAGANCGAADHSCHGLRSSIPVSLKSLVLHVARVAPNLRQIAAICASATLMGRPAFSRSLRRSA